MKKLLIMAILAVLFVQGCAGTANGFGQLISGMGDDIQDMSSAQYTPSK